MLTASARLFNLHNTVVQILLWSMNSTRVGGCSGYRQLVSRPVFRVGNSTPDTRRRPSEAGILIPSGRGIIQGNNGSRRQRDTPVADPRSGVHSGRPQQVDRRLEYWRRVVVIGSWNRGSTPSRAGARQRRGRSPRVWNTFPAVAIPPISPSVRRVAPRCRSGPASSPVPMSSSRAGGSGVDCPAAHGKSMIAYRWGRTRNVDHPILECDRLADPGLRPISISNRRARICGGRAENVTTTVESWWQRMKHSNQEQQNKGAAR